MSKPSTRAAALAQKHEEVDLLDRLVKEQRDMSQPEKRLSTYLTKSLGWVAT